MRIKMDDDVMEWLIYNEKKFHWDLKPNAPKEIIEKFEKYTKMYEDDLELTHEN